MSKYVSLNNQTTFSILHSLLRPIELFKKAKELGQTAVAVTDIATLAGAWDSLLASRETGVKLIMGEKFYFVDDLAYEEARLRSINLYAKNYEGYQNLLLLHKESFDYSIMPGKKLYPRIDWKLLEKYSKGLICLTSDSSGILGNLINARKPDEAREAAIKLKEIFGDDLGLEMQPHAMKRTATNYNDYLDQAYTNNKVKKFGEELGIRLVPTTNAMYVNKEQAHTLDVMLAIGSGQPLASNNRARYPVSEFYIKSYDEIKEFFSRYYGEEFADSIIANSIYFADKCENPEWIDPKYSNPSGKELPTFPVKDEPDYQVYLDWLSSQDDVVQSLPEDKSYLRFKCIVGMAKIPREDIPKYEERVKEELEVLEFHGFSSYMLVVADYVNFAKRNNINVGPGRGSVAACLVAYLIGIHNVDPMKYEQYGMIFARFHNKYKTAYPDIDLDFHPEGREKVIEYVVNKYGEECVAHVSNIITLKPKNYVKDIARTFEYGGSRSAAAAIGQSISDTCPDPTKIKTMNEALEASPLLQEYGKRYKEIIQFKDDISGKARDFGTHAAAVIVGKRPLKNIVPLRKDKHDRISLEYEKERAEANGLIKMDFLGLETLAIIDNTYKIIKYIGKDSPPNPPDFYEYDKKTYDLISRGNTLCVFQLGKSGGTIALCKKIKPKSVYDIAIINALARPAVKEIREDFAKTKAEVDAGEGKINIKYPSLKRAFEKTYGFGLFEECLMILAQDVAGWDLHDADKLRKLTKEKGKNPEKVKKWRKEFIDGAIKNNIPEAQAVDIWDNVVQNFGGYGFNIPHAVAYSMIGYHTAYLKAHYPLEFLTANLMSEVKKNKDSSKSFIVKIKNEIRKLGVTVIPPDINKSDMTYKVIDDNTLMTGLDSLMYMGKNAIPEILKKRPFSSLEDFLTKVDGRMVTSKAVQALAASGALDSFGIPRKTIFLHGADYKQKLKVYNKRKTKDGPFQYPWPKLNEWIDSEKFALEERFLGEGISGNFYTRYDNFFFKGDTSITDFRILYRLSPKNSKKKEFVQSVKGVIKDLYTWKIKKKDSRYLGRNMAKGLMEDVNGNTIKITIFPDSLDEINKKIKKLYKSKIGVNCAIQFSGSLSWYDEELGIAVNQLLAFHLPPQEPLDLESRKVKMERTKKVKKKKIDPDEFLEEVEEDLVQEGMTDVDDEDDLSNAF